MNTFNHKFILIKCPTDLTECDRLSAQTTIDYGLDGWELVAVTAIPSGAGSTELVLAFQKEQTSGEA